MPVLMVGPQTLASVLAAMMPDLTVAEIESDIRSDPAVYYSDYLALCSELGTQYFSEDGWADLCRS